jgi:hypothetical protein
MTSLPGLLTSGPVAPSPRSRSRRHADDPPRRPASPSRSITPGRNCERLRCSASKRVSTGFAPVRGRGDTAIALSAVKIALSSRFHRMSVSSPSGKRSILTKCLRRGSPRI